MKRNELKSKGSAPGIRTLGILVLFCLCCIAMVPSVAAYYPNDKWLAPNVTVLANTSTYGVIDGVTWTNKDFFGVVGNAHYNTSTRIKMAYNWTQDPGYTDRYYMTQLMKGSTWYNSTPDDTSGTGVFRWFIVDQLNGDAYLFKKSLGDSIYSSSVPNQTYYLWYGNNVTARGWGHGRADWFYPTYENATWILKIDVTWT